MVAIPIIDIGPLVNNAPDAGAVAATIGRACRETGFFYVVGPRRQIAATSRGKEYICVRTSPRLGPT